MWEAFDVEWDEKTDDEMALIVFEFLTPSSLPSLKLLHPRYDGWIFVPFCEVRWFELFCMDESGFRNWRGERTTWITSGPGSNEGCVTFPVWKLNQWLKISSYNT